MRVESNIDEVLRELQAATGELPATVERVLESAADEAVAELRATTHRESGALAAAWARQGTAIVNPLPYATNRGPDPAAAIPANLDERVERAVLDLLE